MVSDEFEVQTKPIYLSKLFRKVVVKAPESKYHIFLRCNRNDDSDIESRILIIPDTEEKG